jgi:transcription initiation factor TFIID subunit 1
LEDGEWISGIIWDDEKDRGTPAKLTLNLNDTNMLFDVAEVEATKPRISEPKYSRKNKRPAIKQAVVKVSTIPYP